MSWQRGDVPPGFTPCRYHVTLPHETPHKRPDGRMLRALLGVMELEGYCQVLRKRGMGTSGAWVGAPANLDSVLRVPAKKQEGRWRFQGTEIPIPLCLSEDRIITVIWQVLSGVHHAEGRERA